MSRTHARIAAAALLVLWAGAAQAHAFLARSDPAGATVPGPKQVAIWYTEEVEPTFSHIEVTNAAGHRVDMGDTHIDRANRKLLHVALKKLSPGRYKVTWHVVSMDTHRTQGSFNFTVAP